MSSLGLWLWLEDAARVAVAVCCAEGRIPCEGVRIRMQATDTVNIHIQTARQCVHSGEQCARSRWISAQIQHGGEMRSLRAQQSLKDPWAFGRWKDDTAIARSQTLVSTNPEVRKAAPSYLLDVPDRNVFGPQDSTNRELRERSSVSP